MIGKLDKPKGHELLRNCFLEITHPHTRITMSHKLRPLSEKYVYYKICIFKNAKKMYLILKMMNFLKFLNNFRIFMCVVLFENIKYPKARIFTDL